MPRPQRSTLKQVEGSVEWSENDQAWVARSIMPDGSRIKGPPQTTPTEAVTLLEGILRQEYGESFAVNAEVQAPKALRTKLEKYLKEREYIKKAEQVIKDRDELAFHLSEKYRVPLRTISELLDVSPQRIGRVINDKILETSTFTRTRPKTPRNDEG
jgi:hypothetical protein